MKLVKVGEPEAIVSGGLFGGNSLFHIDTDVRAFTQKIDKLGVTNIRWPGGSVSEGWFDPANPDQVLLVPRPCGIRIEPGDILSFTEIMNLSKSTGRAVDIVIPTSHILNPPDASGDRSINWSAVGDIKAFVTRALQPGGQYPDGKIASFDVGNEYWGSGLTSEEYGLVLNVLAKAIQQGIEASGVKDHPKVLAQVGDIWGPDFKPGGKYHDKGMSLGQKLEAANQDIIDQLDSETRKLIDGVIDHFYPRDNGEIAFGGTSTWAPQKKHAIWTRNGMDVGLHMTEWNLKADGIGKGKPVFSSGIGMLEAFEYMVRMGVQSAHVWPLTQRTTSDLTGSAEGGAGNLSSNGAVFMLLSQNVRGLRWQSLDIEDVPEIESSFYTGENKSVLFLAADEGVALDTTLDLSALVPAMSLGGGRLRVSQSRVVRDASLDRWVGSGAGAQIVSSPAGSGTALAVSLQPYEILMVRIEWVPAGSIIQGTQGDDVLIAGDMSQSIQIPIAGDMDLSIQALGGNDSVRGGGGNDTIWGGEGDDTLRGGSRDDLLYGEDGNDVLHGNEGADQIFGGAGTDVLQGGNGDDELRGDDGDDTLHGGAGNDIQRGGGGNDLINSDSGSDTVQGGEGDDTIFSGSGDDLVYGERGNDSLVGGLGNDTLDGGAGNDTLHGQAGSDLLSGGGRPRPSSRR